MYKKARYFSYQRILLSTIDGLKISFVNISTSRTSFNLVKALIYSLGSKLTFGSICSVGIRARNRDKNEFPFPSSVLNLSGSARGGLGGVSGALLFQ